MRDSSYRHSKRRWQSKKKLRNIKNRNKRFKSTFYGNSGADSTTKRGISLRNRKPNHRCDCISCSLHFGGNNEYRIKQKVKFYDNAIKEDSFGEEEKTA